MSAGQKLKSLIREVFATTSDLEVKDIKPRIDKIKKTKGGFKIQDRGAEIAAEISNILQNNVNMSPADKSSGAFAILFKIGEK